MTKPIDANAAQTSMLPVLGALWLSAARETSPHHVGVSALVLALVVLLHGGPPRWTWPCVAVLALLAGLDHEGVGVWLTLLGQSHVLRLPTLDALWSAFPLTTVLALLAIPVVLPSLQPGGARDLRLRGVALLVTLLLVLWSPHAMTLVASTAVFALVPLIARLVQLPPRPWQRWLLSLVGTLTIALAFLWPQPR